MCKGGYEEKEVLTVLRNYVKEVFTSISISMNSLYSPKCCEPGVPVCCTGVWMHDRLFSWQLVYQEAEVSSLAWSSIEEHLGETWHEAVQLNKRFGKGIANEIHYVCHACDVYWVGEQRLQSCCECLLHVGCIISVEHNHILIVNAVFLKAPYNSHGYSGMIALLKENSICKVGQDPPRMIFLKWCKEDIQDTSPLDIWSLIEYHSKRFSGKKCLQLLFFPLIYCSQVHLLKLVKPWNGAAIDDFLI